MSYARELWDTRELLWNLTLREVRGKYRRTVLGQLWSLINPLASMLVYTIVFSFILRARPEPGDPSGLDIYPLWLLAGLLPWTYFSRATNGALGSIIGNSQLVKKVYFPRMHLPLSMAASIGVTWLIEMGVLVAVIWIFGGFPLPWLPLTLVFMVLLALFSLGVGMLLAIANVHFRDTQHFVTIALQLWLYLTPIIYPVTLVENAAASSGHDWILTVYRLNPIERFVSVFRALLYDNRWPDLSDALWCVGWALVVALLGYLVFSRQEKRLAELL
jgi:ABC-type polysaccharide/polyol phosphate export permease